jgi:hypothetical protein
MSAASTIAPARPLSSNNRPIEPAVVEPRKSSQSEQCMEALARANEVRLARAALKREIGAGQCQVADVVLERPWQAKSMTLSELLCSQRRWGRARSRKLLASAGLNEAKRLGTLTARQQGVLVRALEAKLAGQTA